MAEPVDDFFVGYGATIPPRSARVVRRAVAALLALAVVAPVVVVSVRTRLAPASFEYGVTRRFRGTLHASPVATLVTHDAADRDGAARSLLLVAPGKHGVDASIAAYDGAEVELAGTLVQRGVHTMIELEPGSIVVRAAAATTSPRSDVADLGPVRLRGEIIDSKCHLGVMNPGDGKTHRACAARCISGGVPPALRVAGATGGEALYLLVGAHGEPVGRALLPLVAEPIEVDGRAERRGDLLVLYAAPTAFRRLAEEDWR